MEKILIIEDEKKLNALIADYLQAVDYRTVSAFDGIGALKIFKAEAPDFVILDVMLPGLDGLDVLRKIRETSGVPVILLTARAEEADKLMGLELGADDYITKPFSLKELAARIRAVSRRTASSLPGGRTQELLSRGDLLLDPERRRFSRGGRDVELTSAQFDIMRLFMKNPGRVFSRMDLLGAFQDDAYEGYERTIDVHIKNIRKVLEPDPASPRYILTVWGVGYKLADEVPET